MERVRALGIASSAFVLGLTALVACGAEKRSAFEDELQPTDPGLGGDGPGGNLPVDGGFGGPDPFPPEDETEDPTTCEKAAQKKSYVGCDYWPTVTANPVWSIFDYAVVVANTGTTDAQVTVTGPNEVRKEVTVPGGELRKIYLPWVKDLKGPDFDECTSVRAPNATVLAQSGAYHLVSSQPVIVYQFNALEYRGAGGEDPSGGEKDWSACPGTAIGCRQGIGSPPVKVGCFSFSNDASLLLPSTAMTGTYRVTAHPGESIGMYAKIPLVATALSITATQPDTKVTVALSPTASVIASAADTIPETPGGETLRLTLSNAGDVVQLLTPQGDDYDFSGSLVNADKPVQVIASSPCINIPPGKPACDHIEETVLPAETLGRHYVVTPPTGPKGTAVKHEVRLFGNKDNTQLSYQPAKPEGCPDLLQAGQAADCGLVGEPFEVTGTNEFGVATFLLGATAYDGREHKG
ncbi:MAG TPA: IgGFc-binding protein, partial [Labilithrix sp.]|nr:IgGFc-binding protein [Labilithrix sp.]